MTCRLQLITAHEDPRVAQMNTNLLFTFYAFVATDTVFRALGPQAWFSLRNCSASMTDLGSNSVDR